MAKPLPLVGIDLGTTNSVVATIDAHGRPSVLPSSEGDFLTPSAVFFDDEGPAIVGKEALRAGLAEPHKLIEAVKREMGRKLCSKPVRGKQVPPAAVSGVILNRLVNDTREQLGPFDHAVVTVPAYFNEPRRKATLDAAQIAGLAEVELINEPTAAALAFGFELGIFAEDGRLERIPTRVPGQYTLLVYDLGGGTFDVTLMRIKDRHFRALVCDGDVQLGGRDWDARIVEFARAAFEDEFGTNLAESAEALLDLTFQAEELKRSLSQRKKGVLRVQHAGNRMTLELTADDLLSLTADLLQRTRMTCELAMMDANMGWDQLDAVLLVGGSSRMPMVRDMLMELTGMEPNRSVSPDHAVALGAALYAQMLWGRRDGSKIDENVARPKASRITNVNSHSLGVVGWDPKTRTRRVSVLIPKNTAIPHSNQRTFRLKRTGGESLKLSFQIVEGESKDPTECSVIGECRLVDLPADLPDGCPVRITFAYRRDGRLFVEAAVEGLEPFQVEIERQQNMSSNDLEEWATALLSEDWDEEDAVSRTVKVVQARRASIGTTPQGPPLVDRKSRSVRGEPQPEGDDTADAEAEDEN